MGDPAVVGKIVGNGSINPEQLEWGVSYLYLIDGHRCPVLYMGEVEFNNDLKHHFIYSDRAEGRVYLTADQVRTSIRVHEPPHTDA